MKNNLGKLSDPLEFHDSLDINSCDSERLIKFLNKLITIRKAEQKLAFGKEKGFIKGPVHLGVGQEAIAVGISENLNKTDRVFGAHRSHSHILSLNLDIYKLFAEVLGRITGFSRGMGGSMHLYDKENGFFGSTPIVAGTVSIALGAALAAKMQDNNDIAVAYIGDGAFEEGVVHECLNFASLHNLPILFVVENNLFASHMNISQRQPNNQISRFSKANEIEYKLLDGNNVELIYKESKKLVDSMRQENKPAVIELVTYRWYGHVDWREDIDVGVERSKEDIQNWKKRDPIARLTKAMIENSIWSAEQNSALEKKIEKSIESAWLSALDDKTPEAKVLLNNVYKDNV